MKLVKVQLSTPTQRMTQFHAKCSIPNLHQPDNKWRLLVSVEATIGSVEPTIGGVELTIGSVEPTIGSVEPVIGRVEATIASVKPTNK